MQRLTTTKHHWNMPSYLVSISNDKFYNERLTLIYHSFYSASVELVELFIRNGSDVSTIDFAGSARNTLIGLADKEEMVKLLISNGANLSVTESEDGLTLLHVAALKGKFTNFIIFSSRNSLNSLIFDDSTYSDKTKPTFKLHCCTI